MEDFLENIVLTDEDGKEVEFEVITKLEVEDTEYFIVAPIDSDEDDAIALKVIKDEDGNEVFATVDDDDEFQIISDAYETLIDEGLFE